MNFNQLWQIIRQRSWLVVFVFVLTVGVTALVTLQMPYSYTASASLVVGFSSGDPFKERMMPSQLAGSYIATQMDVLLSHRVALKVVGQLGLEHSPAAIDEFMNKTGGKGKISDWIADQLLKNIELEPSRASRIITIRFTSSDPRFAAAVANAFAKAYIETNLEMSVEPAKQYSTWFVQQIKVLRDKVGETQAKLTEYQQEKGIVAGDERLDTEVARLTSLASQLSLAQAQSLEARSRLDQVIALEKRGLSYESLPEVLSSAYIQKLKSDLFKQQSRIVELARQFGENHPQYQRASDEVKNTEATLDEEIYAIVSAIRNNVNLAKQREASLEGSVEQQKQKILELKQGHNVVDLLQGEVANAQAMYETALQRFNQTSMESKVDQADIAVLNEALEPIFPSSPKLALNLLLSSVLGVMLGLGLVLLSESFDRRVRSEDDLVDGLGLPVLGILTKGTV